LLREGGNVGKRGAKPLSKISSPVIGIYIRITESQREAEPLFNSLILGASKRGTAPLLYSSPSLSKGGGQRGWVVKYRGEVDKQA